MNQKLQITLKSIAISMVAVLVVYALTFLYKYVGLFEANPGMFYSMILDLSISQGWIVFFLFTILMTLAYRRYLTISRIKSSFINGFIWGFVIMIISQLIVAVFRAMSNIEKDPDIALKTLSLLIASIVTGLIISCGTDLFYKKYSN